MGFVFANDGGFAGGDAAYRSTESAPFMTKEQAETVLQCLSPRYRGASPIRRRRVVFFGLVLLALIIVVGVVAGDMYRKKIAGADAGAGAPAAVAARQASVAVGAGEEDVHLKQHLGMRGALLRDARKIHVTHCGAGDASCDWQAPAADVVEANTRRLRLLLLSHDPIVVMFYSPGCPHCATHAPAFVRAAKDSSVPHALVNAHLVDRSVMVGGEFDVTHFPFIARKSGDRVEVLKDHIDEAAIRGLSDEKHDAWD